MIYTRPCIRVEMYDGPRSYSRVFDRKFTNDFICSVTDSAFLVHYNKCTLKDEFMAYVYN